MVRAVLLMVLVLCAATPLPARALSCAERFWGVVLPGPGSQAPRNTRVWLGASHRPQDYRWMDATGATVAFSVTHLQVGSQFLDMLTPQDLLQPAMRYRVDRCPQNGLPCQEATSFTTSDAVDNEPPPLPNARRTGTILEEDDENGDSRFVQFAVSGDVLVVADADRAGGDQPLSPTARLADASSTGAMSIGSGPCFKSFEGASAVIRFGTFDLAGNFSGFGDPVRVVKPGLDGCAVHGSQHLGWFGVLAVMLLWRRRKQPRSS